MSAAPLAVVKSALRGPTQKMSSFLKTHFDSHDAYGSNNQFKFGVLLYASVFFYFKTLGPRTEKKIREGKTREKQAILNYALSRAGIS